MNFEPLFVLSCWSIAYWIIAFAMSIFWGFYSLLDHNENVIEKCSFELQSSKNTLYDKFQKIDAFISDFLLSLLGWGALYLLIANIYNKEFGSFNIFLGSIAILCITGYGFKIADKMKIGNESY